LPLIDAVRAILATTIAWHHFALYGPLADEVPEAVAAAFYWLKNYRWAVQAFFVISGYVLARTMSPRVWNTAQVGRFVLRRYCRLGIPYLATILLAIAACALARPTLAENVIGPPPTFPQIAAHMAFLQDILGFPSLSAGLWFVCIDFQLGLMYVGLLLLRDLGSRWSGRAPGEAATALLLVLGSALAGSSLFYFNLDDRFDVWGVYYFANFFLGVMIYHALQGNRRRAAAFAAYIALIVAALAWQWRWRLAVALATGLMLFASGKTGLLERWPRSRVIAYLGLTSFSLFLVHYPVLIVVETIWVHSDWLTPGAACTGLVIAYAVSLLAAALFFRFIEAPAAMLGHRIPYQAPQPLVIQR